MNRLASKFAPWRDGGKSTLTLGLSADASADESSSTPANGQQSSFDGGALDDRPVGTTRVESSSGHVDLVNVPSKAAASAPDAESENGPEVFAHALLPETFSLTSVPDL
jgi:hypothetical protein